MLRKKSRQHNCSNVLVLGANYCDSDEIFEIINTWLATPFTEEDRHVRRLNELEQQTYDDVAAIRVLEDMAGNGMLCPRIVKLLMDNFDAINQLRSAAQQHDTVQRSKTTVR